MPYIWFDARDATAVQDRSLVLHGGPGGVRDEGLLLSALARPQQLAVYGEGVDRKQLAAAYTAGVARNHPFIDGSPRTGFIRGVLFLELNGLNFIACEEDAADAVLSLAAGTLDEVGYVDFLSRNVR